jgi:hypothetical protein
MSHNAARHGSHPESEDADVIDIETRRPGHRQDRGPRRPASDGGGGNPDEPDQDEFQLIGDNDLGPADLGPIDPNAPDPDTDSGQIRKIARDGLRDTRQ